MAWGCKKDSRVLYSDSNNNPTKISEIKVDYNLKDLSCGAHHTIAYTKEGRMFGWGKNDKRQLINSEKSSVSLPKEISLNFRVSSVAAGWSHSICATVEGRVFSWGSGEDGQLGLGET